MNQPQPGEIIEGVQAMRPHLETLLGEQAASVESELASLLDQPQQPDQQAETEKRLLFVISHYDPTREWLFNYFKEKQQLEEDSQVKSYQPLPGQPTPVPVATYCCPQCNYKWSQFFVGAPIPQCPTDHVSLILC